MGAVYSAGATSTTWDFEAGFLKGWTSTGDAFLYQPTYGDNSRYRVVTPRPVLPSTVAGAAGQSSRLQGLYYVSTYDRRPGNKSDYSVPDESFNAGYTQVRNMFDPNTSHYIVILSS